MICEQCKQDGKTSRVSRGLTYVTAMGYDQYYDENGKEHFHDPNKRTTSFACSNGHQFEITRIPKC